MDRMQNKINTGITDHTGEELFVGDCVVVEGWGEDMNGYIINRSGEFWVKYIDDGDEIKLIDFESADLEKLKTFSEAVETGKVKPSYEN